MIVVLDAVQWQLGATRSTPVIRPSIVHRLLFTQRKSMRKGIPIYQFVKNVGLVEILLYQNCDYNLFIQPVAPTKAIGTERTLVKGYFNSERVNSPC